MNEYGICFAITDNATTIILVACAWITCKNAFLRVENKKGNCRVIGTGNLSFNRYYQIALQWLYQILGSQTVYDTTFCSIPSFSSVQLLSRVRLFTTLWTAACQAALSVTNSRSLLKLMSIKSVKPSNHLMLCHPLLPPSVFPSIRVLSNESVLHIRWPKYCSFSFSISPPMNIQDWFPLGLTGCISLLSKRFSRVFSNTTVQKHQFFSAQLSL